MLQNGNSLPSRNVAESRSSPWPISRTRASSCEQRERGIGTD